MRIPGLGAPVQIAYAVPDAAAAAAEWAATYGAGPFFVRPHITVTNVRYRGRPAEFDHTSAYGQWGGIMVELVQDHGAGPSAVRDMYAPEESGLHHLAFFVDVHPYLDRFAADVAILDVSLVAGRIVDHQGDGFTAVRASDVEGRQVRHQADPSAVTDAIRSSHR